MFVLRCTQKLLDRLNATPDSDPAPADTVLGDWYANLIRVGRIQVVLEDARMGGARFVITLPATPLA